MALEELLEGAAQSVRAVLGEDVEIYLGRTEQGAAAPCVYLETEEGERRPLPFGREELSCRVTARFLPKTGDADAPRAALEGLTRALAVVPLPGGGSLRGTQISGKAEKARAEASARYALVLSERETGETMDAVFWQAVLAPPGGTDDTETEV